MSDSETNEMDKVQEKKKRRAIFPWVLIVVVATLLIVLNFFDESLAESVNMDPAVKHLAGLVLPVVTLTMLGLWYLIRRARSFNLATLMAVLATLAPFIFFLLFQPVFGGNANLETFEPRFWGAKAEIVKREAESKTSRLTTTEFDFPQFLGPERNGAVRNVNLAPWTDSQPELLWKQPVGDAWSGFAIVNGFAITQEQRDDQECVVCYEVETGNTVWIHSVIRRHEDYSSFGRVGPRATPTIHNGNVYAIGGTGVLDCLNGEDGSVIWSYDIAKECGIEQKPNTNSKGLAFTQENSKLTWGRSQSPLVIGNKLIVAGGGVPRTPDPNAEVSDIRVEAPGATLIALDLESGEEIWRGGDRSLSYGSPILTTVAGVPQILMVAEDHCVSHDPDTGKENWSFSWPGDSNSAANCSQVTVLDDNYIMLSKGYATGAQVLLLEYEEGKFFPSPVKKDPRILKTKFSNPVIRDGFAYSISDRFLECAEAKELKKKWRRRGFGTGQLLLVGDKLLVHAESGKLALVKAEPDSYQELGSIETVEGTCWNTLAFYKDLVLVRSDQEAACYRLPLAK